MERWLAHYKKNYQIDETHVHTGDFNPSRLNKKQKIAYKIIKKWVKKAKTEDNFEQILMQIQGMLCVAAALFNNTVSSTVVSSSFSRPGWCWQVILSRLHR